MHGVTVHRLLHFTCPNEHWTYMPFLTLGLIGYRSPIQQQDNFRYQVRIDLQLFLSMHTTSLRALIINSKSGRSLCHNLLSWLVLLPILSLMSSRLLALPIYIVLCMLVIMPWGLADACKFIIQCQEASLRCVTNEDCWLVQFIS